MLLAVNYHYVRPRFAAPYDGIHGVTPEELDRQLAILGELGTFVSAAEVRDAVRGRRRLPERALLVTFDDGLREQVEHALPVLERRGVSALFFVSTAPILEHTVATVHKIHLLRSRTPPADFLGAIEEAARDEEIDLPTDASESDTAAARRQYPYDDETAARLKYLLNFRFGWAERGRIIGRVFAARLPGDEATLSHELYLRRDDLSRLAAAEALGTHGHEHRPLGQLSAAAAGEQVVRSVELLAEWTGRRPFALSYPYGGRDACPPAAAEAAGRAGIDFAFTMERAGNADLEAPMFLGRFDCNDLPGGRSARFAPAELFATAPAASWHRRHLAEARSA